MRTHGRCSDWSRYRAEATRLEEERDHSFVPVSVSRSQENERRALLGLPQIPARTGKIALVSNFCIHAGCGERFDGSVDEGCRGGFGVSYSLKNGGDCNGGALVNPSDEQRNEWLRDLPAYHDALRAQRLALRGEQGHTAADPRGGGGAAAHGAGAPVDALGVIANGLLATADVLVRPLAAAARANAADDDGERVVRPLRGGRRNAFRSIRRLAQPYQRAVHEARNAAERDLPAMVRLGVALLDAADALNDMMEADGLLPAAFADRFHA